jgi:hypothetical protein
MPLNDTTYQQELKKLFFQKIAQEWELKWSHFPHIQDNSFNSLPNLSAFVQELLDDMDLALKERGIFTLEERSEALISPITLRRMLENKKDSRLQTHTRNCLLYYLGYDSWEDFKEDVIIEEQEGITLNDNVFAPSEEQASNFVEERIDKRFLTRKAIIITVSTILVLLLGLVIGMDYQKKKSQEEKLRSLVRQEAALEFKIYHQLPNIDSTLLNQLSNCFSEEQRSSYDRLVRTVASHTLKNHVIHNKNNPSSYKIIEPIEVMYMNDSTAELKTREYWNLTWFDTSKNSYASRENNYDELNEQRYFMVKEKGVWKIGINNYPNKSVQKVKYAQ